VPGEHMLVTGQWAVPLASTGGHLICEVGEGMLYECTNVCLPASVFKHAKIASGRRAL